MEQAVNFYELKTQLADLGFTDPSLVDELREMVAAGRSWDSLYFKQDGAEFSLSYNIEGTNGLRLYCIDAAMDIPGKVNNQVMQYFKPDVPATAAVELLRASLSYNDRAHDPFIPLDLEETQNYIHLLKSNIMNTQNLEFLKDSLKNLGFGDQLNGELEKQIQSKSPEFELNTQHEFNQQKVDYSIRFKAGDQNEMYFLNSHEATLHKGEENEIKQSFQLKKGHGVTAKEAFNLMEGRAAYKQLYTKENEKYQAWVKLDPNDLTQNGEKKLKKHNFDVEKFLEGKGIKEMNDPKAKEDLVRSLHKGNRQQITVEKDGKEQKYFIAASPQYKTVDLFDQYLKKIKREELFPVKTTQNKELKQKEQQGEGLPEKRQPKKSKQQVA